MNLKLLRMTMRVAWRSLQRNKLRSALTMLGIIFGAGAVIAMVAISQGAVIIRRTRPRDSTPSKRSGTSDEEHKKVSPPSIRRQVFTNSAEGTA